MKLRTLFCTIALVGMASVANAAAITGSFSIAGTVAVNNPGVTVDQASSISFNSVSVYVPGTGILGSLAPCTGSCGTGGTLSFNSMVPPYTFTASNPLFSLTNGLSFTFTGITNETRVAASADAGIPYLTIAGTVLFHLAGYADTAGMFGITTQGVDTVVTFSASGVGDPLPEPASLTILAGSLAALGLRRYTKA